MGATAISHTNLKKGKPNVNLLSVLMRGCATVAGNLTPGTRSALAPV